MMRPTSNFALPAEVNPWIGLRHSSAGERVSRLWEEARAAYEACQTQTRIVRARVLHRLGSDDLLDQLNAAAELRIAEETEREARQRFQRACRGELER